MGIKDPASRIDGDVLVCFAGIVQVGGLAWISHGAPPNGFHWLTKRADFFWQKDQLLCGEPSPHVTFSYSEEYLMWELAAYTLATSEPMPCLSINSFYQFSEDLGSLYFMNANQGTPEDHPYHYGSGHVTFLTPP